jgi:P27 family predicted phage terminase small subunit
MNNTPALKAPATLTNEELTIWNEIIPRLSHINDNDIEAIQTYCQVKAIYNRSLAAVRLNGVVVEGKRNHEPIKNPAMAVINVCLQTMNRFYDKFGLNPASRVRLKNDENSPLDELLSKRPD